MQDKSLIVFLIVIILVISFVLITHKKDGNGENYDYLVLVNKYSQLPDDWESKVELVKTKNVWNEEIKIEKETYNNYLELKEALAKEDVIILLDSVYRSVKEQQNLWTEWTNDPEKGIDYVKQYLAVPGYSEHHTGLAVDICIKKDGKIISDNDEMIAEREIFEKIHNKLADYGFILRYLEDKDDITGYSYEPWHLRYIGDSKIAKEIMSKNITLEEYLGSIENIKETKEAAKYQIEIALRDYLKEEFGDNLDNSRFNVTKIYTDEEVSNNEVISSLKLGKKDIAFEVIYQLLPAFNINPDIFITADGEYDNELGWVVDIHRVGILKSNEDGSYSITNFGTGF